MVDLLFGPVPSVGRGVDVVNLLIFHCQSTNLHHLGLKKHIRHHGFIEFIVLLLLLLLLLLVFVVVVVVLVVVVVFVVVVVAAAASLPLFNYFLVIHTKTHHREGNESPESCLFLVPGRRCCHRLQLWAADRKGVWLPPPVKLFPGRRCFSASLAPKRGIAEVEKHALS